MEFQSYNNPAEKRTYTLVVISRDEFNKLLYERYLKICNMESLDGCIKYTGLYENHNNEKNYIYKVNNTFVRVEDCKLARDINSWNVPKSRMRENAKFKIKYASDPPFFSISDRCVSFQELLKLDVFTRNSLHIDNNHGLMLSNDSYIIKNDMELYDLLTEFKKLDNEIQRKGLESDKFELIKFIYDYYKKRVTYHVYEHGNLGEIKNIGIFNFISSEHIANCLGCSISLKEIYNYYGIKADTISTITSSGHGMLKMYLDNGKVTYIDLSREISEFFRNNEKCSNLNKYDYFLKSKRSFDGKISNDFKDFLTSDSIDVCDKYGNKKTVIDLKGHHK